MVPVRTGEPNRTGIVAPKLEMNQAGSPVRNRTQNRALASLIPILFFKNRAFFALWAGLGFKFVKKGTGTGRPQSSFSYGGTEHCRFRNRGRVY